MSETIVGIDLGTTNSAIAVAREGAVEVLAWEGERIMPSVVGVAPDGRLLVGTPARNQLAAFPERTVRSIKRRMGTDEPVRLGDRSLVPQEVSALILKELVRRAGAALGSLPQRAVITVPAFFRDAQRQATRAAGEIAGLDVVRVVNEPTAAALAHDAGDAEGERLVLVYDLGGGTFDVSLVLASGSMTEVLASHGDTHLGGDDFDRLLADDLAERIVRDGGPDLRRDPRADARLLEAAQAARHRLSEHVDTRVQEEFVGTDARGAPVHVDLGVGRERLEELIAPLVEKTLDAVHEALSSAGRSVTNIDDVVLVGGTTRTPLVVRRLEEVTGRTARGGVDPDLSVALGASLLGARAAGTEPGRVLVDVTPYSFGPSHLGELDGRMSPHCCHPVIHRNTPLPVTRSETYYTACDEQEAVDVRIFQGESPDARENVLVGRFWIEGLSPVPAGNEIACRMSLDLDGILTVEAIERRTGLSKSVRIEEATARMDPSRLAETRRETAALWTTAHDEPDDAGAVPAAASGVAPEEPSPAAAGSAGGLWREAREILERTRSPGSPMAPDDAAELRELRARLDRAVRETDAPAARSAIDELTDLLYYVEQA